MSDTITDDELRDLESKHANCGAHYGGEDCDIARLVAAVCEARAAATDERKAIGKLSGELLDVRADRDRLAAELAETKRAVDDYTLRGAKGLIEANQRLAAELERMRAVVEAARGLHEECQQAADHRANPHRSYSCPVCDALAALDGATDD